MIIQQTIDTWEKFRALYGSRNISPQYTENDSFYFLTAADIPYFYELTLEKGSEEAQGFEEYKESDFNQEVTCRDKNKKQIVKGDSRPPTCLTQFMNGYDDCATWYSYMGQPTPQPVPINTPIIGMGKLWEWDFSNAVDDSLTDLFHNAVPSGRKAKIIKGGTSGAFIENVWIKEGCIYFHNAPKVVRASMGVMCPPNAPYKSNYAIKYNLPPDRTNETGNWLTVFQYVGRHGIQGSAPMGDELNTEACLECPIPPFYDMWFYIETNDTDNESNGYVELEGYREKSVILP